MRNFTYLLLFIAVFALLLAPSLKGQVTISPVAVFLDPGSNVGSFHVSNPAQRAVEVSLSFEFAYSDTDEEGNVFMNYENTEAEEKHSLKPYLRAFPTTFVLEPNERQTIRLVSRIPRDNPDGMYWARMRVTSAALTPPIGETTGDEIVTQINMQFDQVTSVFARHGDSSTGISVQNIDYTIDGEQLRLLTTIERSGNSPFIGRMISRLLDSNGNEVKTATNNMSVYFTRHQRTMMDISDLSPGDYTLELRVESNRRDISSNNLLQIPPVTERTTVTIE